MPVDFKDFGLAKLKAQLAELQATQITIGYQGESGAEQHENADVPVAQVAAWQEYGTETAPARPFLRTTFQRHNARIMKEARLALSNLIDGRVGSVEEAQDQLGESALAALRDTIDDARAWAKPLAPSTARAKGHDLPLFETGHMRRNASYAVRKDGSIVRQGGEE